MTTKEKLVKLKEARLKARDYLNTLQTAISQEGSDLQDEKRFRYYGDIQLDNKIADKQESIEILFERTEELEKIIFVQTILDVVLSFVILAVIAFIVLFTKIK